MQNIYEIIADLRSHGKDLVIVTVTEKDGMGPADVGKKNIFYAHVIQGK